MDGTRAGAGLLTDPRLKPIAAGIAALVLSVGLARFAYTPMLPIMKAQAGLTDVAGGWLAGINYAGYMSGALLAATLKSLRVKYHIYRLGLVLAVVTTLGMGLTDWLPAWAVLRYFSGFSSTAGLLLASGLVLNWLLRNGHIPRLGLHFIGMGLGIMLSGLLVEAIQFVDWAGQWRILGWVGLIGFLPAWFWMPKPPVQSAQISVAEVDAPPKGWMTLYVLIYFCAGIGYVISATFIVDIVKHHPAVERWGNYIWVLVGLAALPSAFVWDRATARLGATNALLVAFALEILSFLLPVASQSLMAGLASAWLFGGTFVGVVSMTLTLIGRQFPHNPAKAMARLTLSYGVAQVGAPIIAGYLKASSGTYNAPLIMAGVGMAVGMVLLRMAHRLHPM